MRMETSAAHELAVAERFATYDAAVKRLLAHKPFLARIMKECMPEYRDCTIEDIINRYIEGEPQIGHVGVDVDETHPRITGMNAEDATLTEGTIHYDIRFSALAPKRGASGGMEEDDGFIRIIVNVEAQNRSNPGYSLLKRAMYYCSRMISAQKGTEFQRSDYDRLKKVYSIWICTNAPKAEKNTITAYAMHERAMVGGAQRNQEEYDLLCVVMICLGDGEDTPEKGVLGMLEVLLKGSLTADQRKNLLEQNYGIPMTERIEKEVGQMCNLSQGVYEDGLKRGMAQGIERGMAQGIERGMAQGVDQNRIESLRALMVSLNISLEQAIRMLNYPMADRDKYAAALS